MIACIHCETENGLDSAFCKSCGLEMPAEAREAKRAELQHLVTEGYALLGQNRTEEAALVAEKVLEDLPSSTDALSLLGMCHERNDDLLAALQCYERVVELNPDSALDKIKVQSLRNTLSRVLKEDRRPNRSLALIGAAAAVLAVASIGGIVATLVTRPASAKVVQLDTPVMDTGAPFATNNLPKQTQTQPSPDIQNPGDVPPIQTPTGGPSGDIRIPPLTRPQLGGVTLPNVGDAGERPYVPPIPPDVEVVPTGGKGTPNPDDPRPDNPPRENPPVTPKEDPTRGIEITLHRGQPRPVGGSEPIQDDNGSGLQSLMKVAQEQYLLAQYAKAATTYERALRAGGDAGRINQRIGQCYERLGKTQEAIAAYQRAESALQSAVSSGRPASQAPLDSVRKALQNLRGG